LCHVYQNPNSLMLMVKFIFLTSFYVSSLGYSRGCPQISNCCPQFQWDSIYPFKSHIIGFLQLMHCQCHKEYFVHTQLLHAAFLLSSVRFARKKILKPIIKFYFKFIIKIGFLHFVRILILLISSRYWGIS
jgi:hypothetical protein